MTVKEDEGWIFGFYIALKLFSVSFFALQIIHGYGFLLSELDDVFTPYATIFCHDLMIGTSDKHGFTHARR